MKISKSNFIQFVRDTHNRFTYLSDMEQYQKIEDWRIPTLDESGKLTGDCDDFACYLFAKGRSLGFDMRVVTCEVPTRGGWGGHAVAYCDSLNMIGDNMHVVVYPPDWLTNVLWRKMSGVNTLAPSKWRVAKFK